MRVCWNITNKCNRNCKFCFRDKKTSELTLHENKKILDNLFKLDVTKLSFAGGEPFLYEGVEELIKIVHDKGIFIKVNTNGSLLDKDNIKQKLKYVDDISFSVDSLSDEENYFLGRGIHHFEHIKEIIPIIKSIYPKIRIEISTVVMPQNIHNLTFFCDELENTFDDSIISRWKLMRFYPVRDIDKEQIQRFSITDEEFQNLISKFNNINKNFKIDFVDIPDLEKKSIINPGGLLEYYKNGARKSLDLKNSNNIYNNILDENSNNNIDYLNTNLNLYKVFFDVAQAGSLSLASKRMLISQPAISKSIKKLEDELGVMLFYRTINGMNLTEKGKELFRYVEDAYNSLKTAERSIMEQTSYKGRIVVGVPSHIASFFIFDKIKKFHEDYPLVEISIVSRSTSDLIKRLENHDLDFVIDASPIEGNEKLLCIEPLTTSKHCFVSLKSAEYNKKIKNISDLEDLPLILPVAKSFHRKKLEELALNCNTKFKNVLSIETSEMIKESIIKNLGIGYILEDVVKRELSDGLFQKIKIEEELPSITINLVYIEKYLTSIPKMFIDDYLK